MSTYTALCQGGGGKDEDRKRRTNNDCADGP